jgi:hypothetical protein
MSTKTCSKCGVEKDVGEFYKTKTGKCGVGGRCKICVRKIANEYRLDNHKMVLERKRNYREENREEINAYQRTPEFKEKRNKRLRKKRDKDPLFRIVDNLRRRVRYALKAQGAKKFTRTMDLIGCSPEFYLKYLERTKKPGVDYTESHDDHIIPCAFFDLTKEEEQKMCFHWSNNQILTGSANQAKSDYVFWSGQVYRPDEVPPEIREEIYAHCRSNMTLRSS